MKSFIKKVCTCSKKIPINLKRHHKKYLFGVLCCGFLALIGTLFFSRGNADSILDFLDIPNGTQDYSFGFSSGDKLKIKNIYRNSIEAEFPLIKNGSRDITSYVFNVSKSMGNSEPVAFWCYYNINEDAIISRNSVRVELDTSSLDNNKTYYLYAIPIDSLLISGTNGRCTQNAVKEMFDNGVVGRESIVNGEDPCFNISNNIYGEGTYCSSSTVYSINYINHVCNNDGTARLMWQALNDVNIDLYIWNPDVDFSEIPGMVITGTVNSETEFFDFTPMGDGHFAVRFRPQDGSQVVYYNGQCSTAGQQGSANGMTITLNPGWNVFSTPALLSSISFSNGGNGISFSKLQNGQWISVMPNANAITPLEGFLVKNSNNSAVTMYLTYKNTTPNEDMLSKDVSRGRNLLGITTTDNPFQNVNPGLHLDFTKNTISNFLNGINRNYIAKNGSVESPEIGEAYGIFLSSDGIYGGSNNRYGNNSGSNIVLYNDNDYSEVIGVTPGSYNIPLLKGRVVTERALSFRNTGFYIQIDGANAYEDIVGYEAGGIIYDIAVNVGSCTSHVDKSLYSEQTDAMGHKRIYIPLFETCNRIPAGTHKISVTIGINSEYATNFKTGMTIRMDSLNSYYLNDAPVSGKIRSSEIEVSHDNLPSISIIHPNDDTEVNLTTSGTVNFSLGSIKIYGNEPGEAASLLFDIDKGTNDELLGSMYVDMYINGNLSNTSLHTNSMMKYLIPLSYNTGTKVSFVGRFNTGMLPDVGSFVPRIIVNSILKDGVTYITQNCHYYRGRCTQFNGGNYIFNGGLYNINGGGDNIEGCPIEDMYACLMSEDYDSCVYHCSRISSEIHNYSAEFVEGYNYAYNKGLTTASNINTANLYGNVTKIALAKIMVKYAIDVLGLTPDESLSCELPNDVTAQMNTLYDNAYTKLCQLRLVLESGNFQPLEHFTYADFGTWLSRALNAGNSELLNELNNTTPYYSGHINWLIGQGILHQINNPEQMGAGKGRIFIELMRADENYTIVEGCTPEQIIACALEDDTAACIDACSH